MPRSARQKDPTAQQAAPDHAEAWEQTPTRCPNAWRAAFAATGQPRISVIEHALLGINAHIVYDLPFAVSGTMRSVGDVVDGRLQGDTLVRRRHDYEVVNHILAETILDAQAVLAEESRVSRVMDRIALRFDEYAAEALLRASRTQGWHNALALAVARDDQEHEAVRQHLDRVACGYVQRLDVTQFVPGARASDRGGPVPATPRGRSGVVGNDPRCCPGRHRPAPDPSSRALALIRDPQLGAPRGCGGAMTTSC